MPAPAPTPTELDALLEAARHRMAEQNERIAAGEVVEDWILEEEQTNNSAG